MAEYITATQVQNRLTPHGYTWVADRDRSGTGVTSDEEAAYVTPAIQYAGAIVDAHINGRVDTTEARAAANQWLMDRCLDLAIAYALEYGGREIPDSVIARQEQTLKWLREVQSGAMIIPGIEYSNTSGSGSLRSRGPRAFNPRRPDR